MSTALRGLANNGDGFTFSTTPSSYPVTLPGTVADGDIALATVQSNGNSVALTTPAGWTLQYGVDAITTASGSWLFYKVLSAADAGTTVTFTFANSIRAAVHLEVISGGTMTGAVFGKTIPGGAATSIVIPTLAGVLAGSYMGVHLPRRLGSGTAPVQTIPAPYTNDQRIATAATSSANFTSNIVHQIAASAGSYGGETVTADVSSAGVAYAAAIPPASAPPPPTYSGKAKIWSGTAWVSHPAKVGSTLAAHPIKFWDGTQWRLAK